MNDATAELVAAARAVCGNFRLSEVCEDFAAGGVGAAIRTASGNIYTGICIDLACGLGFCAEVAAISDMLKHRETHIVEVVAVAGSGGSKIIPPCGRCRETMSQVDPRNIDCRVILEDDRAVLLRDLLPEYWMGLK